MPTLRIVALALAATLILTAAPRAQDAPKDEALDELLKKLDAPAPPGGDAAKPADEAKPAGEAKPADEAKPAGEPKPSEELAPKDKALDELLEKLGQTEETPSPGKPEPPKPPAAGDPDAKPKPEEALGGKEKTLDEHLEELLGRKRKKPRDEQEPQGEGGGPLSDIVKKMREVEQRLGEPDTGEQTREEQQQIVKRLDEVIQQLRNSSGGGRQMVMRRVRQQGNQPGEQQGGPGAQGNTARGVGPSKPERPGGPRSLAHGKDEWGHLPPELRDVMENISKEEYLPARIEMIRRYYLSVSRRGSSREE